jgi:hypothetical protein
MSKASTPQKLMTTYVSCMMSYKGPQPRQGTRRHYLRDVSINDWIIVCG